MDKGFVIWFTGLPCSGKSTLAWKLFDYFKSRGRKIEVLDGDVVRKYFSKGLGFSKEGRDENIRRVGFVSKLLSRNGVIVLTACISPYRAVRDEVREDIKDFVEVYVKSSLEECMKRDVKGMYQKALNGEIENFTGISDPYEEPQNPEVIVDTDSESPEESTKKIILKLSELGYIKGE